MEAEEPVDVPDEGMMPEDGHEGSAEAPETPFFKSMVESDRLDVFLDLGFFAEDVDVEGTVIPAVLDEPTQGERSFDSGLASATYRLFARAEDLPKRKRPGSTLLVNKRSYIVEEWREDMGVVEASLVRAQ